MITAAIKGKRLKRSSSAALSGTLATIVAMGLLSGCANSSFVSRDGPSLGQIKRAPASGKSALLVEVTDGVARQVSAAYKTPGFAENFGLGQPYGALIGPGDNLQITLFEAPPALLFGSTQLTGKTMQLGNGQRGNSLPELMVDAAGQVEVPFAGLIDVLGRSPRQVADQIAARLRGKAHDPQVVVNISKDAASAVTVVGEVAASTRMALTFKGERLLDALAAAGGSKQPVDKVSLELTRGSRHSVMPLDDLISQPHQNIYLRPGDVVTVSYKSASFTVLGATGRNDEIEFEARGISLAQALGRMGGLRDDRANPHGVFIFRLEDPAALGDAGSDLSANSDGKIPVIYRINLRDPGSFFAAQRFNMRNHDVVYVTNAPSSDVQKFVNIIGAAIYPIVTARAAGL